MSEIKLTVVLGESDMDMLIIIRDYLNTKSEFVEFDQTIRYCILGSYIETQKEENLTN